jgi:type II secretory pathway component PulM
MAVGSLKAGATSVWAKRTPREKVIFVVAGIFLSVFVGYPAIVSPVVGAFSAQSARLERIHKAFEQTPKSLERYKTLLGRRQEIDAFYAKADISAEPLSHLEGLLRTVAQAAPGSYNIAPKEGVPTAGKYTHRLIDVSFQTSSYENLVAFLKELTGGKQPMLISRIDLTKAANGSVLSVKLDVSGFEPIAK